MLVAWKSRVPVTLFKGCLDLKAYDLNDPCDFVILDFGPPNPRIGSSRDPGRSDIDGLFGEPRSPSPGELDLMCRDDVDLREGWIFALSVGVARGSAERLEVLLADDVRPLGGRSIGSGSWIDF